jgi:MOSC domain-containing protein YiiM
MKVGSVNIATGTKLRLEERTAQNKLEVAMHKRCLQLSAPDDELRSAFTELRKTSIQKLPQESITVKPGGVVGDRHFEPDVIRKYDDGNLYNVSVYNQVSLLSKERYRELNQFYNKNIVAGQFGENIQTEGIERLEGLSQGTILQFGDTAQIKITHLRTYCYKFANVLFPTVEEFFYWKKHAMGRPIDRIGVIGQVICEGIIRPNDPISIVYKPMSHVSLGYIQRPHGVASRTLVTKD